jgi:putative transposase
MKQGNQHRKLCRRYDEPFHAHELTFSCYRNRDFLSRDRTRLFLAKAVNRARTAHSFDVWAYVMMPEHVHLVIWPHLETYSIATILKAIKQSVSRQAIRWLRSENPSGLAQLATGQKTNPYRFWQDGGGYDRNIQTQEVLRSMIEYVHANPVRRGLVDAQEDWLWSSYRDWHDLGTGPIPIDRESCDNSLI